MIEFVAELNDKYNAALEKAVIEEVARLVNEGKLEIYRYGPMLEVSGTTVRYVGGVRLELHRKYHEPSTVPARG